MNKKIFFKHLSKALFFLTFYYCFTFLLLPNLVDPKVNSFSNYYRLYNWDKKQHVQDDLDDDEQTDFVSFTGCIFLSSTNESDIPESQKCTAQGIFESEKIKFGQKYIDSNEQDSNLNSVNGKITHSYLSKKQNKNWQLFVNSEQGMQLFEIKNNQIIQKVSMIPTSYKIDEILYSISSIFFLLSLPLIPLTFIFSLIFNTLQLNEKYFHLVASLSLLAITMIFYLHHRFKK